MDHANSLWRIGMFNYPFMVRAIVAGIITGALAGFIGVFVVLRKMSFYANAIAHASLSGVALGFLLSVDPFLSAMVVGSLISLGIGYLFHKTSLFMDTAIGVFLPVSMAIGIILFGLTRGYKPELISYLFGSILSVSLSNLLLSSIIGIVFLIFAIIVFKDLTMISFDVECARARGINVTLIDTFFLIFLSLIVVIGTKTVGIVLISALIVIPAASARLISRSFKEMIIYSVAFGVISSFLGLTASYYTNLPSGATIVVILSLIFTLSLLKQRMSHEKV